MSEQTTREERVEIVNKIIVEIKQRGHNFFRAAGSKVVDGHFKLRQGKLYWFEEYHQKYYRLIHRNRQQISHGGGLWAQLLEFRDFIESGIQGQILSRYWGYPDDDVRAIHAKAKELGYLSA